MVPKSHVNTVFGPVPSPLASRPDSDQAPPEPSTIDRMSLFAGTYRAVSSAPARQPPSSCSWA